MARAKISGFEDVEKLFDSLSDTKKLSVKAVETAAPKLVESAKKTVKSVAIKGYATDGLAGSFVAMKPKTNEYGSYVIVRPVGKDHDGHDYYARGAYLEYGTKVGDKQKNPPQPWRDKSVNAARSECEKIMEETVYAEVDKL